jgi:hypothetical protein
LDGEEAEEGTGGAGSVVSLFLKISHYEFFYESHKEFLL